MAFFQKAVAKISPFDQPVQQERFLRQGLVPTVVGHSMVQAWGDRLHEREQHELLVIGFTRTHTQIIPSTLAEADYPACRYFHEFSTVVSQPGITVLSLKVEMTWTYQS